MNCKPLIIIFLPAILNVSTLQAQGSSNEKDIQYIIDKIKFPLSATLKITMSSSDSFITEKTVPVPDTNTLLKKLEILKKDLEKDPSNTKRLIETGDTLATLGNHDETNKYYFEAEKLLGIQFERNRSDTAPLIELSELYLKIISNNLANRDLLEIYTGNPYTNRGGKADALFSYLIHNTSDKNTLNKIISRHIYFLYMTGQYESVINYSGMIVDDPIYGFDAFFLNQMSTLMLSIHGIFTLKDNYEKNASMNKSPFSQIIKSKEITSFYNFSAIDERIKSSKGNIRFEALQKFIQLSLLMLKSMLLDTEHIYAFDIPPALSEDELKMLGDIERFFLEQEKKGILRRSENLKYLASINLVKKNMSKTFDYLNATIKENPSDQDTILVLLYLYTKIKNEPKNAIRIIENKIYIKSDWRDYIALSYAFLCDSNKKQAVWAVDSALQKNPNGLDAIYAAGIMYVKIGAFEKAETSFAALHRRKAEIGDKTMHIEMMLSESALLLSQGKRKESFEKIKNMHELYSYYDESKEGAMFTDILKTVFPQESKEVGIKFGK